MRETTKSFEKSFGWRNCNRLLLCWDAHAKDDYDGHKNFLFDDFSFESRGGDLNTSQKYFFNRQNFITYSFLSKRIPSKWELWTLMKKCINQIRKLLFWPTLSTLCNKSQIRKNTWWLKVTQKAGQKYPKMPKMLLWKVKLVSVLYCTKFCFLMCPDAKGESLWVSKD